jgi:hypothetical protein
LNDADLKNTRLKSKQAQDAVDVQTLRSLIDELQKKHASELKLLKIQIK